MRNPFVDEAGYDTAHYLFADVYLCNIPLKQLRSLDEIRSFGMPSVWDPEIDRQISNEVQTVMINIDKIFEHWRAGSDVRVVKPEDTKRIYERVNNHLLDWKTYMSSRLNQGNAPVDDLIELDRFASVLYEHAKFHGEELFMTSFFSRNLSNRAQATSSIVGSIRSGAFLSERQLAENPETTVTEESIHARYPTRPSMVEDFANHRKLASLNAGSSQLASQGSQDSVQSFASMLFGEDA